MREPSLQSPAGDISRLRDAVNELRSVMCGPGLWKGGEPPRVVSASIDALCGIADELDESVARCSHELERVTNALHESERESRLIIESIPGLVSTSTPSGAVDVVTSRMLEYFGATAEQLKQWPGDREADHSRRSARVGCGHAAARDVQPEGLLARIARPERGDQRGGGAVAQ